MSLYYKTFFGMDIIYFFNTLLCFDLPYNKDEIKDLLPFCYSQISGSEVSGGRGHFIIVIWCIYSVSYK